MRKMLKMSVIWALVTGLTAVGAFAAATVPFSDDFEDSSLGSDWSISGVGTVMVTTAESASGSQACVVSNAVGILNITGDPTNVWVGFYAKSGLISGTPEALTNVPAAICIDSSGNLQAWTGAWTTVTSVSTNIWHGFSVHLDYGKKAWDIYYTTNAPGATNLVKLNSLPLPFGASSNSMHDFSIDTEMATYVDEVAVSRDTAEVDPSIESPTNAGGTISVVFHPGMLANALCRYFTDQNNTLGGPFGDALKSGLNVGDKVHIWNGTSFDTFTLAGTEPNTYWDPSTTAASTHVSRTTGFWVETSLSTVTAGVAFAAFNDNSATNIHLDADAWAQLQWPWEGSRAVSNGLGFTEASWGDTLYVYRNGSYTRLWRDAANNRWMQGRYPASFSVSEGQGMWIYTDSGAQIWHVDTAH